MTHWNDGAEWLQCEDEFLSENRRTMTMEHLSSRLGRSQDTILVRLRRIDHVDQLFDRIPPPPEAVIAEVMARTEDALMARVREDIARG